MKKPNAPEPDVPNARFWFATLEKPNTTEMLFLECERWHDARTVARAVLGAEAKVEASLDSGSFRSTPAPRVQVRWTGNAARRVPDLRIETRRIDENGNASPWEPLR